jgi:hypothetical protein
MAVQPAGPPFGDSITEMVEKCQKQRTEEFEVHMRRTAKTAWQIMKSLDPNFECQV